MSEIQPDYDVAIIGGGVSGIYTAWRLLTAVAGDAGLSRAGRGADGRLKVAVFEGSDRIGGRLLSARPPGMPSITCEIGGMRYVSSQRLIRSLVENVLSLPRRQQVVDDPRNIAYLRRKHLRIGDLTDAAKLPYDLTEAEVAYLAGGAAPSTMIGWAIRQLLPETARLRGDELHEYLQGAEIDGTPLYQHGFWNLLARVLSHEAFLLARTTVGYDSLGINANAVDLVAEHFSFAPDVEYHLLDGGFDVVPLSLRERFEAAGGTVETGAWLKCFDAANLGNGDIGVTLQFCDERPPVCARALVLAMPRRSLQLLRPEGPILDPDRSPRFQKLLNSVEPIQLYKMFMVFDEPWWESRGVVQGRSVTDIPLRQCYYWGTEQTNNRAAVMTYNDMSSVEFWGGLRRVPLGTGGRMVWGGSPAAPQTTDDHGPRARLFDRQEDPHSHVPSGRRFDENHRKNWDDHHAPHAMVAESHRQLAELHGVESAPEPIDAAYMDWGDDPYGGAVHYWNPGYRSWEIVESMTQPVDDFPCFVCGEAFSTNQTWVEGALETAEIVLQKRFGLAAPDWLTDE